MNIPGAQQGQRTANAGLTPRAGVVYVTSSATVTEFVMTVDDRSLKIVTDGSNALSVVLPSVAEAGGMFFFFYLITDSAVDVTITDKGDDLDFNDVTMDTANDAFVAISDGIHWFITNGGDIT